MTQGITLNPTYFVGNSDSKSGDKKLSPAVAASLHKLNELVDEASAANNSNGVGSEVSNGDMALAVLFLQNLQAVLNKLKTNQDQLSSEMSTTLVQDASAEQVSLDAKAQQAYNAAEKAAHESIWEKVIGYVAGGLAILFSGGLAAGLVMGVMFALQATGVMNDAEQAIASKFKDSALGSIVGKLCVLAAVVVLSGGLGGISMVTDAAAKEAVGVAAQDIPDIAEEEVSTASKWTMDGSKGMRMAKFQAISGLATSDIWMDAMNLDPSFVKKNPELAKWLNIVGILIGVLVSLKAGHAFLSEEASGTSNFVENIATKMNAYIPISWAAQTAQGTTETVMSVRRMGYLNQQSDLTNEVAQLTAELDRTNAGIQVIQTAENTGDTSVSNISDGLGEESATLAQESGSIWAVTNMMLAG